MDSSNKTHDEELMQSWYQYAAEREGSVDSFLRVLRNQLGHTLEQQQNQFGATDSEFDRLRGFGLPRPRSFAEDAKRIAEACHLTHSKAFVNTMLLVFKLSNTRSMKGLRQYYQAAFDDTDELDKPPEDE